MTKRLNGKLAFILLLTLLLASCTQTPVVSPSAQATQSPVPSVTATAAPMATATATTIMLQTMDPTPSATPLPLATPTGTSLPLPTLSVVPNLPDPGKWAATLKLDAKDYPRVDGSTATLPLGIFMRSKITGESLAESTADTVFTTTGPAWEALANKTTDLLVVYEAPGSVKSELKDKGAKLTTKPIGMDALVFLTNKNNAVNGLTARQIIDIYTGKIKNWSKVGGSNIAIIPYQRIENSGSQALMLKLVMKDAKMMPAPKMLQPSEMGELIDDLASYDNTSNALGYSVYYYVSNMYSVPGIKLLNVDGVAPSSDTIASGAYPYINPFYAVIRTDEPANSNTHKLFDWLTGAEGKRAITDAGYVAAK